MRSYRKQLQELADAIVKGNRKRSQAQEVLFSIDLGTGTLGESCALGAAYEGAFGTPPVVTDEYGNHEVNGGEDEMYKRLEAKFPILDKMNVDDPREEFNYQRSLESMIISLNDSSNWSRGRIARWIRGLAR